MADGAFEKDFGYLMPFLDKVAAQTGSLADPAAREELARLMAGERKRWARIRELLSGSAGRPASNPAAAARQPVAQSPSTGGVPLERRLTVGSLRNGK